LLLLRTRKGDFRTRFTYRRPIQGNVMSAAFGRSRWQHVSPDRYSTPFFEVR
jgi:hypothetical protein